LIESGVTSGRPKTLILDIYGRYAEQFQGWLPVSNLVDLMGLLDIDEQAVRSAVSRMARHGLLERDVRDGVRGYRATAAAEGLFAEADRRIYATVEPASVADGWVLVSFSMPENKRDQRHALRSRLMWLGMGIVSSGLWIAPARARDEVIDAVRHLGFEAYVDVFTAHHVGLGEVADVVSRAWDLDELAASYQRFLRDFAPVRARIARLRSAPSLDDAFATYTLTLHAWRKFPYLDPGLPAELLARDWPGRDAADLFRDLRQRLEPIAFEYAAQVVATTDAAPPASRIDLLFS